MKEVDKKFFFGDKELSREFVTSRSLSDVEEFVKKMAKREQIDDPSQEQVREITRRYQEFYVDSIQRAFCLSDKSMMDLHKEFNDVADKMLSILQVNEGKDKNIFDANKKYLETYPYLYFSVVPRQVIQSRLADKTVEENKTLRDNLSTLSESIGDLVKKLSDIQTSIGIPPIARSVFGAIPDPISVQYDTIFDKYRRQMDTYYKIVSTLRDGDPDIYSDFLLHPLGQLQVFIDKGVKFASKEELENLSVFIKGVNASSSAEFVVPE